MIAAHFQWKDNPLQRCERLDRAMRNKVIRIAMNKAASPVKAAVIANAPSRTGSLKKAIRIKIKNYHRGTSWVVVIGASSAYKRKGIFPVKYSKLVEVGTRYTVAHPYLRPALKQTQSTFINTMTQSIEQQLGQILK